MPCKKYFTKVINILKKFAIQTMLVIKTILFKKLLYLYIV